MVRGGTGDEKHWLAHRTNKSRERMRGDRRITLEKARADVGHNAAAIFGEFSKMLGKLG
jgi:hypothetical protein